MSYTLAIIDMQPQFDSACNINLQEKVITVIKNAIDDKASIIFVEYGHRTGRKTYEATHPTFKKIKEVAKGYKKKSTIIKTQDGGGDVLVKKIRKNKFPIKHIKFCGVNLSYCVASTIYGTEKRLPHTKIELLADATGDYDHMDDIINTDEIVMNAQKLFRKVKNMRIA